ncbi:MAG TPA: homoserine kinase [bacterium]|nr:homoserine kinase [bacterium]
MSVYTRVERPQLEAFLHMFNAGELVDYVGISAGIENTNYFVTTDTNRYVLTLFEQLSADELPFFLNLMAHLAEHGVPTAHPLANRQASYLDVLCDKPAALVQRLSGGTLEHPGSAHCAAIGAALAHMHLAGQSYPVQRANPRGPHWWREAVARLHAQLHSDEAAQLDAEISFQFSHRLDHLPRGIIHADLFRDNALFEGEKLSGIIDLYYACSDALLYDVAITVNDWCVTEARELDPELTLALLAAYAAVRPFSAEERAAWPVMLRAAALRFWLSRLLDLHFPREGELTHTKDPQAFARLLRAHQRHTLPLPA